MLGRWLRWEREQAIRHRRDDVRRGFALGLSVAGAVLAWLELQ